MKKKKSYQFGNNQKKANNLGKGFILDKESIKANLEAINRKFLTMVPQKRIIEKTGKPLTVSEEMIEVITDDFGRSASYKTKEYIKDFFTKLIEGYISFSRCGEEEEEYKSTYNKIKPGEDINKLMETIYRFSTIKQNWDTQYLKDKNVGDRDFKRNLYNACMIDCIGLYNCYANSLSEEEDDELIKTATIVSNLLDEDF